LTWADVKSDLDTITVEFVN